MEDDRNKKNSNNRIPTPVLSFVIILLASVLAYKIATMPLNFSFEFSLFLSLVLAIFAVGLAALFYFKTTQTSNTFYDNTYKFTKDIAELLVRIESWLGERLRNLDRA